MSTEETALGTQGEFVVQRMSIVNRNTVGMTALGPPSEDDPNTPQSARVISVSLKTGKWGWQHFDSGYRFGVAGAIDSANSQLLFWTNRSIGMLNYEAGPNGMEPGQLDAPATITAAAWIDGHFYGCGRNDFFGRRDGPDDWTYFSLATERALKNRSFGKIVGRNMSDIYLATNSSGSPLPIYHWDGKALNGMDYPDAVKSSEKAQTFILASMTMAPDGRVFLGGTNGQLLVGTAQTGFIPVIMPELGSPKLALKGMAWFEERLWAVDGAMLKYLDGTEWVPQPFWDEEKRPFRFEFIQSGDESLLVGSQFGASIYTDGKWRKVFGSGDPDQWLALSLMEKGVEDLNILRDSARKLRDLTGGGDE